MTPVASPKAYSKLISFLVGISSMTRRYIAAGRWDMPGTGTPLYSAVAAKTDDEKRAARFAAEETCARSPYALVCALRKKAAELANTEVLTMSNAGTYTAAEAHAAIGVGDPCYADCREYTRVGNGAKRREGPDAAQMPGRARRFSQELTDCRAELAAINEEIERLEAL